MTPGARLQATVELLEEIEASPPPADAAARRWLRRRRYVGAGDRRAITDAAFACLRGRFRLDWTIARHGGVPSPRLRALVAAPGDPLPLCDGRGHAPPPPDARERALVAAARRDDGAELPLAARLGVPAWLEAPLGRRFGAALEAEAAALNAPAALDLRVNSARARRGATVDALRRAGLDASQTPLSPVGVRVAGRPDVRSLPAFRRGLIEIQDEASQIAAALVGAGGAGCVVDYCAGAGGKTLALAAAMRGRGRLVACDTDAARLARARPRLARAGAAGAVETHVLGSAGIPPAAMPAGGADRVLVDAPCSGSGTWRRNPDAPRRLTPDAVAAHAAHQGAILAAAAPLVRVDGRLVYAVCSVLEEENEAVVATFLAACPAFRVRPVSAVWRETLPGEAPGPGPFLLLTPHRHGTDGFFVAVLERGGTS